MTLAVAEAGKVKTICESCDGDLVVRLNDLQKYGTICGKCRPKASKYKNKPTEVNGRWFPSQHEAKVYNDFVLLLRAKRIKDFDCQVSYELQPSFTLPSGEHVQPIRYIADFVVKHHDGSTEIVDAKGFKTEEFKMKWKILKFQHRRFLNVKFSLL